MGMRDGVSSKLIAALQGGGAHGAYTWGVLDRLLEEPWIEFTGFSGTSAGAMNAVVCAHGLARGGRAAARAALAEFWYAVGEAARLTPVQPGPLDRLLGDDSLHWSPGFRSFIALTRVLSPYQFNPLNVNPLRDILEAQIDFERLRAPAAPRLWVAATRVRTGTVRLFTNAELSIDAVLASACLPSLHQAVVIDGELYWDGGYSANPPVRVPAESGAANDLLLVLLAPLEREGPFHTAPEILGRASEIAFHATFIQEMQGLAERAAAPIWQRYSDPAARRRYHLLAAGPELTELPQPSKLNADRAFLDRLFEAGRSRAEAWLAADGAALGRGRGIDLADVFGEL
mgnify:CR=1 FL=1